MTTSLVCSWRAAWSRALVCLLIVTGAGSLAPRPARAGGLYLMPRGVEAASRGGARVAGSDDPNALWYNPAGLHSSGKQLLVDFTLPIVQTEFTRLLSNGEREPTVDAPNKPLPIPTLAYTDHFGLRDWAFGAGLLVPTGFVPNWPETLTVDGKEVRAPQRYSVINTDGSALGSLALGAAYHPAQRDWLTVGATVMITTAFLGAEVAVSACDYFLCRQPEGREWEGRTRFLLGPVFGATASLGAKLDFDVVRIGASAMAPTRLKGEADFDVRLPDQAAFDDVQVQTKGGSKDLKADMSVRLPAILRLGVELLPVQPLKVELGLTYETWSVQDSIKVKPKNVEVTNVPTVGTVAAQPVTLARNMQDTWAVNLGGKYSFSSLMPKRRGLDLSAGAMFETGAFKNQDLSPTTIDTKKLLVGVGASVEIWPGFMLDATYGHIFMQNRKVRNSKVLLPSAVRPRPQDDDPDTYDVGDQPAIGNGDYVVEADFVGLGVRWIFGATASSANVTAPPATPGPGPQAAPAPPTAGLAPAGVVEPPAAPAAAPAMTTPTLAPAEMAPSEAAPAVPAPAPLQ